MDAHRVAVKLREIDVDGYADNGKSKSGGGIGDPLRRRDSLRGSPPGRRRNLLTLDKSLHDSTQSASSLGQKLIRGLCGCQ